MTEEEIFASKEFIYDSPYKKIVISRSYYGKGNTNTSSGEDLKTSIIR